MAVRHALLGILSERQCHGYDLKAAFDERMGDGWNLNFGQIYSTLERLERDGEAECHEECRGNRPTRKVYQVTRKGKRELEEWLTRNSFRTRALRDEFLIKLFFCRNQPDKLSSLLANQKVIYLSRVRELIERHSKLRTRRRDSITESRRLLVEAALMHARADLRWIDESEQRLIAARVIPESLREKAS